MTMRSFRLVVAGFILGVGLPIHIGMMGHMWVVSWAIIATWAILLILECAAHERKIVAWVEAEVSKYKEKDDA